MGVCMRVGVCMCACGCVGGGRDMVYGCGCGCESGQDENSDYTCASYYSLLIRFECVSYCLFYSAFL